MKKLAVIGLIFMLTACGTLGGKPLSPIAKSTLTLAGICASIGKVYIELDVMRDLGVLGSTDISVVKQAVAITDPLCLPGANVFDLKKMINLVDDQLTRMIIIQLKKDN